MQKYIFVQNNSGGSFDNVRWTGSPALGGACNYDGNFGPEDRDLWVLAESESDAMDKAKQYANLYFDGVDMGFDCECCGDRWYPPYIFEE